METCESVAVRWCCALHALPQADTDGPAQNLEDGGPLAKRARTDSVGDGDSNGRYVRSASGAVGMCVCQCLTQAACQC